MSSTSEPIDADRRASLIRCYRDGLLDDVLPFWTRHAVDREHGGFMTCLDRDGSILDTDKGVWVQGRFTWLLGELYNTVERRDPWLELCNHGIDFLSRYAFDPADGRMWFHLTRDGRPIRKRRYAFSESFAALAYGEHAKATGSDESADRAHRCFTRFVEHVPAPKFTGTRPAVGIGHPMIVLATAQELRDSIGLPDAAAHIDRCIDRIASLHMKHDLEAVVETVAPDGSIIDHFDGRMLNPGHAIEAAWFVMHEGRLRGDDGLVRMGCTMLDWMWRRGWDAEHGGLLYFVDLYGKPVQEYWHDMKFWWPHNEAIIATLYAWLLTGERRYARMHAAVHDWAYSRFPDPEHGEWFGYLHRDGRVSVPLKGNLWKGPFHLPRMQLVCWKLLESTAPAAVATASRGSAP